MCIYIRKAFSPEDILIVNLSFKSKVVLILIVKCLRIKLLLDLNQCMASSHNLNICR